MNVMIFYVVVAVFLLLKADKTSAICEPGRKEFNLKFTNKSLDGPALGSFVAMGEISCQYACHSHDKCDMYNFNTETNRCEILDARSSVFKMKYRRDWIARAQKCETDPCKNGGSCYHDNGGARCLCACDWKGEVCDVPNTIANNVLFFPGGSISDKVFLENPFTINLTALTVSTWVQVQPTVHGELAAISYATSSYYNSISLSLSGDMTEIVINDNWGEFTAAGETITDNDWHHLGFTWERTSGTLVLYIDGIKKGEKTNLATGEAVQAGGFFVLGQEQDSINGDYDVDQAFKGHLTSVNIWDSVLTASGISSLAISCPTEEGNVVQWSKLKNLQKNGNVRLICSPYCIP